MFTEDIAVFLNDFGLIGISGGAHFKVLLDMPETVFGDTMQSVQYEIQYETGAVTLRKDSAVTIDGINYKLREHPKRIDDGKFSKAVLSKI